jgi:hypothetical protein
MSTNLLGIIDFSWCLKTLEWKHHRVISYEYLQVISVTSKERMERTGKFIERGLANPLSKLFLKTK